MRKIKLGKRGLSPLVAVIVLLTLVMVLGAIIAGTLSGAPRPVLPATTAVNLAGQYGANPGAGEYMLVVRHEYGSVISDAIVLDPHVGPFPWDLNFGEGKVELMGEMSEHFHWNDLELKINGKTRPVALMYLTVGGEVKVNCVTPDLNVDIMTVDEWVWPQTEAEAGAMDFAAGDWIVLALLDPEDPDLTKPLESGDLIQVLWLPRDLMLVEYLVQ